MIPEKWRAPHRAQLVDADDSGEEAAWWYGDDRRFIQVHFSGHFSGRRTSGAIRIPRKRLAEWVREMASQPRKRK